MAILSASVLFVLAFSPRALAQTRQNDLIIIIKVSETLEHALTVAHIHISF